MLSRHPQTLALALCLSAVSALDLSDPANLVEALQAHRQDVPAPSPTAFLRFAKRQTTADPIYTITGAGDSTCGYLSASAGNAITCENGGLCSWENDYVTAMMCQNNVEINMKMTCIEKDVAEDESRCNDVCQSNSFNLLCTESSAPFCRTYQYPGGIRDYRCASTTVTAIQSVAFTYSRQNDRFFTTQVLGDVTTSTTSQRPTRPTTTFEEPSTSTEDPTSTSTRPPTSGGDESNNGDNGSSSGGGGGGPNIGAIVGGALGGAALLAIIGFGIYFLRRRSKSKEAAAAAAATAPAPYAPGPPPPMQQQQQPPMYPGGPGITEHYGWKGGAAPVMSTSPVHSPTAVSPYGNQPMQQQQQPYDAVSDVQSSRLSNVYSMSSPTGTQPPTPMPMQGQPVPGQQQQPVTIHEAGDDAAGHHRGQLHEMQ